MFIILERKNAFLGYKTRSSKIRKIEIFEKGLVHGFWSKICYFSVFFILGNMGQENLFYDIVQRKNVFLGYKSKNSKWSKIGHFSIFFYFRQYRPGKCVL